MAFNTAAAVLLSVEKVLDMKGIPFHIRGISRCSQTIAASKPSAEELLASGDGVLALVASGQLPDSQFIVHNSSKEKKKRKDVTSFCQPIRLITRVGLTPY